MDAQDISWSWVSKEVQGLLVQTLTRLDRAKSPIQFPLFSETCLPVKGCNVLVDSNWIYDRVSRIRELQETDALSLAEGVELLLPEMEEEIKSALDIVRVLWTAMWTHWGDLVKDPLPDLIASVVMYLPFTTKDQRFIPFLKYQLSYLFAKRMYQRELPEPVSWNYHSNGLVLQGPLGRLFKRQAFGKKMANWEFANTILHGIKKGLPQMGPFLLAENLKKHSVRLSTHRVTPKDALVEIERTTREVCKRNVIFEEYSEVSNYGSLSSNACFEQTRSSYGPLGYCFENWLDSQHEMICYWIGRLDRVLDRMVYVPRWGKVEVIRHPFNFVTEQLPLDRIKSLNCIDAEKIMSELLTALDDPFKGVASVKAIFEPLKVRLITAGDYLSNGVWGSLQKVLWRRLQLSSCFRLTGKSVEVSDVEDIDNRSFADFDLWVSGDYSAATDNMHMDTTMCMIENIAGDPITKGVLMKGLVGNLVTYKDLAADGVDVPEEFVMRRGQLMGCIFSFPLLCIANLAMYRYSLEQRTGLPWKIRELPVLVNGDDILFKADRELVRIWEDNIKKVGFEKSIGKNYVSRNFAIINSTLFDTRRDQIVEIPYLNMGWVTGVTKGGGTLKKNKERVKTVENDVRRIRPQIDQTREDWIDSSFGKDFERRVNIFRRYQRSMYFFNRDEILKYHLPLDMGVHGLGLSEQETTDPYTNGFRRFLSRSGKGFDFGTQIPLEEAIPEVLGTWKLQMVFQEKSTLDDLHSDYRSSSQRRISKVSLDLSHLSGSLKRLREIFSSNMSRTCAMDRILGEGCDRLSKSWQCAILV